MNSEKCMLEYSVKKQMQREAATCPYGHPHSKPYRIVNGWTIRRCLTCSQMFTSPRPTEEALQDLYDEPYFKKNLKTEFGIEETRSRVSSQIPRVQILEEFTPVGRLLDVGCALGHFLAAAQERGWEVKGLEFSEWAAYRARQLFDLDVIVDSMENIQYLHEDFDVITMWHVLEHSRDPIRVLSNLKLLLREEGILVVQVPNCSSFDARVDRSKWRHWSIPYHFYHFTPTTLQKMLESVGFDVLSIRYSQSYWTQKLARGLVRLTRGHFPVRWVTEVGGLATGANLTVIAKN